MAITNAQQFKQLVNPPMKGKKRPGYRGEAAAASDRAGGRDAGRSDTGSASGRGDGPASNDRGRDDRREQYSVASTLGTTQLGQQPIMSPEVQTGLETIRRRNIALDKKLLDTPFKGFNTPFKSINFLGNILGKFGYDKTTKFFSDNSIGGKINPATGEPFGYGPKGYSDYMEQRRLGTVNAFGNQNIFYDDQDDNDAYIFPRSGIMAEAPSDIDQESETTAEDDTDKRFLAFRADGGRIGLQEGGGIEQRLEKLGGDVTSAEKLLQGINKRLETAESSLGSGGGGLGSIAQPFVGGIAQPLPGVGPNVGNEIAIPSRPGPFMGRPLLQPINATLPGTLEAVQPLEAAQPILAGRPIQQPPPIPAGAMVGGTITADNTLDEIIASIDESRKVGITPLFGNDDGGGLFSPLRFDDLSDAFKFAQRNAEVLRRQGRAPILDANTGKFAPFAGELSFDDFSKNFSLQDGALIQDPNLATAAGFGGVPIFNTTTDPTFFGIGAEGLTPQQFAFGGSQDPQQAYLNNIAAINANRGGIPAAGYADGGNVVGGEYDFESARQMYGLGKLVKKVTKTVKKIAKSPVGKAAIAYGLFRGFKNPAVQKFLFGLPGGSKLVAPTKGIFGVGGKFALGKGTLGIGTLIGGTAIATGLLTADQEKQAQQLAAEEGMDIETARNSILAKAQGNVAGDLRATAFLAEGGKPEPVAKKTMPLLDMGGKEMDLREEGGFVPIGRMEKADDVPARLSKNEFVFTADAVRNAGDGDVDKGAEVMYNMMKNLEAGGEVSEESQGLEGARKMFQTSQRLEEVL